MMKTNSLLRARKCAIKDIVIYYLVEYLPIPGLFLFLSISVTWKK